MNTKKLNLIEINTTAYNEENFYLVTDLLESQIKSVIKPIVLSERKNNDFFADIEYDNDTLVTALKTAYPKNVIIHHPKDNVDLLSI